jgi:glycosyltransferase involved in cell wall biosynthesis
MEEQATGTTARVGVVTPSLNAERYLERTMESIWSQASEAIAIDHVLVDGGSTDDTLQIAARYPSRTVVATDDRGMYDAINRGFALVDGEIVGYMNADDEIAPDAMRTVVAAFAAHPEAQWLCGTVEYIDASGAVLGRMTPVSMSLRSYVGIGWSPIPQQTVWARRGFYDRVGPFDTTFRNTGDYDWYARAMALSRPLILKETLGRFRLHGDQLSFDPDKMARESRLVQDRHGGRGARSYLSGKMLSLRLNATNPSWLIAKKTRRIRFTD